MLITVELGLNLAWSALLFELRCIGSALAEVVRFPFAVIADTIVFWRVDRLAGVLFVP